MSQIRTNNNQEEWLKVLGKGMITLPKRWRDQMGIESGNIIKAKKEGDKVIIETQLAKRAPYRVYSKAEIDEFLKDDKLSKSLTQKVKKKLSVLSTS